MVFSITMLINTYILYYKILWSHNLFYVYDMLNIGTNIDGVNDRKKYISLQFKIKYSNEVNAILYQN